MRYGQYHSQWRAISSTVLLQLSVSEKSNIFACTNALQSIRGAFNLWTKLSIPSITQTSPSAASDISQSTFELHDEALCMYWFPIHPV